MNVLPRIVAALTVAAAFLTAQPVMADEFTEPGPEQINQITLFEPRTAKGVTVNSYRSPIRPTWDTPGSFIYYYTVTGLPEGQSCLVDTVESQPGVDDVGRRAIYPCEELSNPRRVDGTRVRGMVVPALDGASLQVKVTAQGRAFATFHYRQPINPPEVTVPPAPCRITNITYPVVGGERVIRVGTSKACGVGRWTVIADTADPVRVAVLDRASTGVALGTGRVNGLRGVGEVRVVFRPVSWRAEATARGFVPVWVSQR